MRPDTTTPILAAQRWKSNAELIADVARLGYIEGTVLDPTFGEGTFWKAWRPDNLCATDAVPHKSPSVPAGVDFRRMPWADDAFRTVVFDPPYKLNGTPDEAVDARYGVDVPASWMERHQLIRDGIVECLRVLTPGGWFLLKCQDQVCSGAIRWQTFEFAQHAAMHGAYLWDRFDLLGYRPQPGGRRQVHAHRAYSTLLVFKKKAAR